MRAILDTNVIISALLAPGGAPAKVLRAWLYGAYELVGSPLLLAELERALGYPKIRQKIREPEAVEVVDLLRRRANILEDPQDAPPVRSPDPGDDYLIGLAAAASAVIVSGDGHLLGLAGRIPVYSPAAFLGLVEDGS